MRSAATSFLRPAARLVALFPGDVVGFETCAPVPEGQLHPGEAQLIRNAIEKRRQEFAGGRLCARSALAELDIVDFPLLVGEKRFPNWPGEVVGSITHTRDYCASVVARRLHYRGIGIDVEQRGRLGRKLEGHVCTEEEREWLETLPASERGDAATVLFSAKEAFYKCQYCVTHEWLGFHDATVRIDGDSFEVVLQKPIAELDRERCRLVGRFSIGERHVFAAIGLRASPETTRDVQL
jgi:4'-phosphopantetheinyl transferase EntD